MNERLVSVIQTKGGDESVFPFVEAYYKEFVGGNHPVIHNDGRDISAMQSVMPGLQDRVANFFVATRRDGLFGRKPT